MGVNLNLILPAKHRLPSMVCRENRSCPLQRMIKEVILLLFRLNSYLLKKVQNSAISTTGHPYSRRGKSIAWPIWLQIKSKVNRGAVPHNEKGTPGGGVLPETATAYTLSHGCLTMGGDNKEVGFHSLDGVLYICTCVQRTEFKRPWYIHPTYLVVNNSLPRSNLSHDVTQWRHLWPDANNRLKTYMCPGATVLDVTPAATYYRGLNPLVTIMVVRGMYVCYVRGAFRVLLNQPCHVGWWAGPVRLGRRFSAHECPASA